MYKVWFTFNVWSISHRQNNQYHPRSHICSSSILEQHWLVCWCRASWSLRSRTEASTALVLVCWDFLFWRSWSSSRSLRWTWSVRRQWVSFQMKAKCSTKIVLVSFVQVVYNKMLVYVRKRKAILHRDTRDRRSKDIQASKYHWLTRARTKNNNKRTLVLSTICTRSALTW